MTLLAVSADYHRGRWSPPGRRLLRRLDLGTVLHCVLDHAILDSG